MLLRSTTLLSLAAVLPAFLTGAAASPLGEPVELSNAARLQRGLPPNPPVRRYDPSKTHRLQARQSITPDQNEQFVLQVIEDSPDRKRDAIEPMYLGYNPIKALSYLTDYPEQAVTVYGTPNTLGGTTLQFVNPIDPTGPMPYACLSATSADIRAVTARVVASAIDVTDSSKTHCHKWFIPPISSTTPKPLTFLWPGNEAMSPPLTPYSSSSFYLKLRDDSVSPPLFDILFSGQTPNEENGLFFRVNINAVPIPPAPESECRRDGGHLVGRC